jgi:peptidoglycan/xylan/chitin deacetylase (PgdA/CDA1 family)
VRIALGVIIALATLAGYPAEKALRPKIVAFTFDDGPRPEFLLRALPYFAKENISVTFFVIGGKANKYPEWIKREFREGHEIENHTMNHVCLAKPSPKWAACQNISSEQAIAEVKRAMEVIERLTGYRTQFVRPPHFAMTRERKREIESALNVRVLEHGSASIGSLDWVYRNPEKIFNQVANTVKARGEGPYVVVFHENDVTLEALPLIIKFFRSRGYEFVRLDEFVKRAPKADI